MQLKDSSVTSADASVLSEIAANAACGGDDCTKKITITPPAPMDVSLLCSLLYASNQMDNSIATKQTEETGLTSARVLQLSGPLPAASSNRQRSGSGVVKKDVNKVFPRRKAGQDMRTNSQPVVLNETVLRELFYLPLQEACSKLGICATALKKACRKLGIKKWPYRTAKPSPSASPAMDAPQPSDVLLFKETPEWFHQKDSSPLSSSSDDSSTAIAVSRLLN